MLLTDAIPKFMDELKYSKNYSAETLRAYGNDLTQYLSFLVEYLSEKPESITADSADHRIIRAFLSRLGMNGIGNASIGRKLSTLRSFYDYLVRCKSCRKNPAKVLSTPKTGERMPKFISRPDVNLLLDEPFPDSQLGLRNRAILELLYATGIRVGELVGIDLEDIDPEGGNLRVLGKGRKQREVVFGTFAADALRAYLKVRSKLAKKDSEEKALFLNYRGGRLTTRSIARILRDRIREVGLRRGISPHSLRHTFATHMLNNGADIRSLQELLGHSSLSTTQRYTQVGVEELMKTYLDCHPRAK